MRIALATIGKFHTFDLAQQLHRRGFLEIVMSGYPAFKLKHFNLPLDKVLTFPWIHAPLMRASVLPAEMLLYLEQVDAALFDWYTCRHLPECDIYHWLSGSQVRTAKLARSRGSKLIVDRGSTHILYQYNMLREEFDRAGVAFKGIHKGTLERETAEYELADRITVPSQVAASSFEAMGIAREKLRVVPYGVNIGSFVPYALRSKDRFDVLFVGRLAVRKGLSYLFEAFDNLIHPNKHLHLVGIASSHYEPILSRYRERRDITFHGHLGQPLLNQRMSASSVLVLPSVEEGLALVQAQAMASGCPVLATEATGARDLFSDGLEGFIVPLRDVQAMTRRLQQLADSPELVEKMGTAARMAVERLGGWDTYGENMVQVYSELLAAKG